MMKTLLLLVLSFWICAGILRAQTVVPYSREDTARVNALMSESEKLLHVDRIKAREAATTAHEEAVRAKYREGEAKALKLIGSSYYFGGEFVEALNYWSLCLNLLRELKDDLNTARIMQNIGAIYALQEDDVKALEFHLGALALAEKLDDKQLQFKSLNNIAGVYFTKNATWNKALEYLQKGLELAEAVQVDSSSLGVAYANLGTIYLENKQLKEAEFHFKKAQSILGNEHPYSPFFINGFGKLALRRNQPDLALSYHSRALRVAEEMNRPLIIQAYLGLAEAHLKKGNNEMAFQLYHKAEKDADEMNALTDQKDVYEKMALAYANLKDFGNAFKYQVQLDKIKEELYDEKIRKKVGLLQSEFELTKKQGEVDLLTKDKELKDAELRRQRTQKYAFTIGFVLVFFIAFILYRNYKAKVKVNKILDHQKEQIEHLLLNILPAQVAKELQDNGQATPRHYESVSVLFTDFRSFTSIAEKMTPGELVQELNECFMAFDTIIEKYSLEKIKTIGDSYMCAAGIPTPDPNHAVNIVQAGIAIQNYIIQNNIRRVETGRIPWEIRVGIHAGPVVAGVVGKKKYAYDIWGSTVNIASRMESNGEPGRVNISSAIYELIKDRYACRYRGKIYAKNVGEVDMYFIEHELESLNRNAHNEEVSPKSAPAEARMDMDTLYG